ncbi:MAG: hypothetical protein CMH98_13025 [Oceanospirillaceae bacterium]|nr:hypothetical protein [Oceanospirillaceae bacterium]
MSGTEGGRVIPRYNNNKNRHRLVRMTGTGMQIRHSALFLRSLCSALIAVALLPASGQVQAEQLSEAERHQQRLSTTAMSQTLPLQKRIRALRELYADEMENGRIVRTFCVWDMLGRSGPVFSTVEDQALRSLHYGLELQPVAYQDEERLVADLRSGACDAALMSGSQALAFNRFAGTLEAPGSVPDKDHLYTLIQVIASPEMTEHLQGGGYIVLGVASLGEHYAISNQKTLRGYSTFAGQSLAVPASDPSLRQLARALQAQPEPQSQMAAVQSFSSQQTPLLMAPLVAFYAAGAGQAGNETRILNYPLSQSTIQMIGREARFPPELAQIIREDFLLKFPHYVRRVEQERSNIAAGLWLDVSEREIAVLENRMQASRQALRGQGVYDPLMLRLAHKVRCRMNPDRSECLPAAH